MFVTGPLVLAPVVLSTDECGLINTLGQKHARLPDSGFVSAIDHAIVLKRIATGIRGVTGGVGL